MSYSEESKKKRELKLKKMAEFRLKCRRQRHLSRIKRRRHAAWISALALKAATQNLDGKPTYTLNRYSLFYTKPTTQTTHASPRYNIDT